MERVPAVRTVRMPARCRCRRPWTYLANRHLTTFERQRSSWHPPSSRNLSIMTTNAVSSETAHTDWERLLQSLQSSMRRVSSSDTTNRLLFSAVQLVAAWSGRWLWCTTSSQTCVVNISSYDVFWCPKLQYDGEGARLSYIIKLNALHSRPVLHSIISFAVPRCTPCASISLGGITATSCFRVESWAREPKCLSRKGS